MNNETSLNQLIYSIKKFCEDRDWDQYHNPKDLAIGIITEASELLEKFRFKSNEEMKIMLETPEKRKAIGEELSDILYFVLRFAQKYNFDLAKEFDRKMIINERKYPIEKCRGSNKKYSEE